jgi:uncharacterized protein
MNVTNYTTADEFLAVALEPLLREEAKNNLILGISMRIRDGGSYGDDPPLFVTVGDGDSIVATAIQTPPHNLIVHCEPERLGALDAIVTHLIDCGHALPGVNGTVEMAEAFAQRWLPRTGQAVIGRMPQRVYALHHVDVPENVSGRVRWAQEEDVETLAQWFLAFHEEAVPGDPPVDPEKNVRRFMTVGKLAVWDDGGAVSMAGSSRGTRNGATVSAVYTPPEHRRHGYASACVAGLSQSMLDDGYQFCTLYTDLSNPTSNKIYQQVGYRPVADCTMIMFDDEDE